MSRCPECGCVIHWLRTEALVWSLHMLECRVREEEEGTHKEFFSCPACGEVIAENLAHAKEFLD